ncbi:YfiR family protein [Alteromonas sp. ASW11-36]|uniref:YfiR family protein n=1 Tax=Alteromonas arenosi TaxID=3055817 RepID=A0ABT7SW23_9ALTE|nr:YfiR family protein [Alteromonas sp. ASW11-36]MDM7860375.1 YfiR family protein [Alteromonas sp. ASW11-36]
MSIVKAPIMIVLTILMCNSVSSQLDVDDEEIKAALVLNLIRFIEWPISSFENENTALNICILGSKTSDSKFTKLNKMTVKQRPIDVIYIQSLADANPCHVMYFMDHHIEVLRPYLISTFNEPTLTIADVRGFVHEYGVIEFTYGSDNRINFNVNLKLAREKNLRISSKLLEVAQEVNI